MKVLHVLNSRIYSGAEKVACQIIHSFETGEKVHMVYSSPYSENVEQMVGGQGVTYLPLEKMSISELSRVLRQEKPDIIHAHDMRASFFSALCCGRTPLVCHIHNNAYNARGLSLKSILFLLAGAKAKKILWVSQSSFEGYLFHKFFAKKSSVLFNILDIKQLYEKKEQDDHSYSFDMIYVGRLTYQKDPQRLMRLCAKIKEHKSDLKVAVVGTGELEEETKQLCAELGLKDNVQFLGFQSNPIKMIADSKALVLTSRWEGTPMCALEALALGTPVVSTPSDGMMDLIENGVHGYLHEGDEQLAQSLLKILLDPEHQAELSRNAVEKSVRINDEEAYKQAILSCYR